jgi:ketosteroid isomerase-like protein
LQKLDERFGFHTKKTKLGIESFHPQNNQNENQYDCNHVRLFWASCSNKTETKRETDGQPEKQFDITAVQSHINEMNKTYHLRFKTSDSALYKDRYCEKAAIMPPGMALIKGRDSIRSYNYDNGKNRDFSIEINAKNVYGSSNLVVEEGSYNFPDGKGGSFDKGKFIALWKEENGKWKLYREIWNSSNPTKK